MVIRISNCCVSRRGYLMIELLVAIALLTGALIPIAYSLASEKRLARATYQRAVAVEIVDGELEALAAGQWHAFTPGVHEYPVRAGAAANLPPGKFLVTIRSGKVRLEWVPAVRDHGGPVVREAVVK
jgi:type II secretory pathway pseudopilin PulG